MVKSPTTPITLPFYTIYTFYTAKSPTTPITFPFYTFYMVK